MARITSNNRRAPITPPTHDVIAALVACGAPRVVVVQTAFGASVDVPLDIYLGHLGPDDLARLHAKAEALVHGLCVHAGRVSNLDIDEFLVGQQILPRLDEVEPFGFDPTRPLRDAGRHLALHRNEPGRRAP